MQDKIKTEQERRDHYLRLAEQAIDDAIELNIVIGNARLADYQRIVAQIKADMQAERERILGAAERPA